MCGRRELQLHCRLWKTVFSTKGHTTKSLPLHILVSLGDYDIPLIVRWWEVPSHLNLDKAVTSSSDAAWQLREQSGDSGVKLKGDTAGR